MENVEGSAVRAVRARVPGEVATRARILIVDDDETGRSALETLLRADGFATATAEDGDAALAEARCTVPDVVLTDMQMPGMSGVELCRRLRELQPDLPVIVMTAFSEIQSVVESLRVGAEDYLVKPLHYDAVLFGVERALARRAEKCERERLRQEGEELYRVLNERLVISSIREREHAEAEALQRAQLEALLANLAEGVVIADPEGRIVMINQTARTILGTPDAEPRTIDELQRLGADDVRGRPLPSEARPLSRALRGERYADYEVVCVRPDGEQRHVASTGTSVNDGDGKVALAIVAFRDVTELRRLEQQRDEFLALVSHDLRNPLGAILTLVATIHRLALIDRKDIVSLAERVERNGKRMNRMIEELTEASSFETHAVALHRVACDLRELVAGVIDSLDDARAKRVSVEADDSAPMVVSGDASRLERVIANLVTNALKYSDEHTHVILRFTRKESEVELAVSDHGIGIPPESVKRLFERYYRTNAGKARAGGLGLGLYIAHMIVEAHGGRIDVSSEVGKGSTFTLTLPSSVAPS
jgi:PAS domain S-box-containing protein